MRLTTAVGNDGTAYALYADAEMKPRDKHLGVLFPCPVPSTRPAMVRSFGTTQIEFAGPPVAELSPTMQVLSTGNLLTVATRCPTSPKKSGFLNAKLYDPIADNTLRFHVGDGIEDVQTDEQNRIWVSYFDEGVYGHRSGIPTPGLNCFSPDGALLWSFDYNAAGYNISDCYALNVIGGGAWICPYVDFPLIHISDKHKIRRWGTPFAGSHGIAIFKDIVLFSHQYNEPHNLVHLARIGQTSVEPIRDLILTLEDTDLVKGAKIHMRGSAVHVFAQEGWYRADISEIDR